MDIRLPGQEVLQLVAAHRAVRRRQHGQILQHGGVEYALPGGDVAHGQHRQQRIVVQREPVRSPYLQPVGQGQLHRAAGQPVRQLLAAADAQLQLRVGHLPVQPGQGLRQPVDGHAGVGADAQVLVHPAAHQLQLPLQLVAAVHRRLDGGEQGLALLRQAHTVPAPLQQGEAHLLLQTVHHVGDAGLGVVQLLGGLAEAAKAHGGQKRVPFLQIHGGPPAPARPGGALPSDSTVLYIV